MFSDSSAFTALVQLQVNWQDNYLLAEHTGLMIHFCLEPLSSQALRSSLISWGRTKVRGKKLNSCLPKRTCILDRFLHSRSFLPIWNVPGKWFNLGKGNTNTAKLNVILDRSSKKRSFDNFTCLKAKASSEHKLDESCIYSFLPSGALRWPWSQETSCGVPSSPTSHGFLHEQQSDTQILLI